MLYLRTELRLAWDLGVQPAIVSRRGRLLVSGLGWGCKDACGFEND